jgi:hypothetical protein
MYMIDFKIYIQSEALALAAVARRCGRLAHTMDCHRLTTPARKLFSFATLSRRRNRP